MIEMKKLEITKGKLILYLMTFIVVLSGDQITKYIVDKTLNFGTGYPIIKNFFYFTYVHNYGAAWGMLEGEINLFFTVSLIAAFIFLTSYELIIFYTKLLAAHDYRLFFCLMVNLGLLFRLVQGWFLLIVPCR